MVVPPPPFPPPPYMDAPGYVLPHPHGQPVDYRRLPHPQTHTQSASHQNPNQTRRIRPNHFVPVREMVNSEVQTEPAQRGISGYELGSDSGRGTRSNSPCSPALSSPKQNSIKLVSGKSPCREQKDSQANEQCANTVKTDHHKHSIGSMAVDSCGSTRQDTTMNKDLPDQEPILDTLSKDGNCNLWLSSSPDGILPVCSSSQKDNAVLKERRISVPDILMNWGDGTPQPALLKTTNMKLSQIDNLPSYKQDVERNKLLSHRSTETNTGSVVGLCTGNTECMASPKVSEMLFRVLRLPHSTIDTFLESCTHEEPIEGSFLEAHSLTLRDESQDLQNSSHNISGEVKDNCIGKFLQEICDVAPHNISASSYQAKRKSNESIWSVESLSPFIPSKEWLLQNGLLDPKVNEVIEEDENVGLSNQNEHLMVDEGRKAGRLSSSTSVQMSENCFCSSIQEEQSPVEETGTEMERGVSGPMDPEESQSMLHSENNVLASNALLGKAPSTPTKEGEGGNMSSEPVATQSTNQNTQILNDLQHKTLSYSEEEMSPDSAREENSSSAIQLISQNRVDIEDEVTVMIQDMVEVSPSKGTLVDCAVQCNELQERRCFCGDLNKSTETNRRHFKSSGSALFYLVIKLYF